MNPGDTVLDLGAHVGWYTKALSELVGPYGRVVAVEPVPTTFEYLAYNVRKLGLRNVVPVAAAVSSHLGHGLIEVPAYEAGAAVAASRAGSENSYEARLITPTEPVNGQRRYAVPLTTIDHLAASDPVQFIKLDVEDHELAALEGAGATIRRDHPAFVIELLRNPDHHIGSPQAGIVQLLAGHGYQAFWWNGAALRACRRPPQHPSSDYFFVRSEHLERLRAAGCTPS